MRKVIIPIISIVAIIFTSTVTCFANLEGSQGKNNGFGELRREFSETVTKETLSSDMDQVTVDGTTSVAFYSAYMDQYKANWKTLSNIKDSITFSHSKTNTKPILFSTISDYSSRTTSTLNNTTTRSTVTLTFPNKGMYNYYEKRIGEACRAKNIYYITQNSTCTATFYGATSLTCDFKAEIDVQ